MHTTTDIRDRDRRIPRVSFRLPSVEVRRQLEAVARAHATTISGYVRTLVLQALRREQEQREYEQSVAFFG